MSLLGAILETRAFKIAPASCAGAGGSPSWPILGSILGPKIGLNFTFLGVIFWSSFWTIFGPLWGPFWGPFWGQIGPRRGQDGLKRAIKSFKDPKICICKSLKKPSVFQGFWGPRLPKTASKSPRRLPRGTQRAPKPEKNRTQKMDPKIIVFLTSFGAIFGAILGSELAPKGDQKWDHFWNP